MLVNEVYENNVKLPRLGKKDFSSHVITRELFDTKVLPKYPEMTYREFVNIWSSIATEIKKDVCTNPMGIKLPFFLGEFRIQYIPYKRDTKDHIASKELGEKVPQLYLHSKGKVGSMMWERKTACLMNSTLNIYAFEPDQCSFRDMVTKALTNTPELFKVGKLKLVNKSKK